MEALPQGETIAKVADYLAVDREWLQHGFESLNDRRDRWTRELRDRPVGEHPRRPKLPPKVYARVYQHLERARNAGIPEAVIEEYERLIVDPLYSKAHTRNVRERSDEELITDVDSAWIAVRVAAQRDFGVEL